MLRGRLREAPGTSRGALGSVLGCSGGVLGSIFGSFLISEEASGAEMTKVLILLYLLSENVVFRGPRGSKSMPKSSQNHSKIESSQD